MEDITLEQVDELYKFLQGDNPESILMGKHNHPKMNEKKAYKIIWFLQEHLSVLPDHYERCDSCGCLYDSRSTGIYWESKGKFFCGGCDYQVPINYDRGKR